MVQKVDLDTRRPFSRRTALAAGLTDTDLAGARFQSPLRGVHLDAATRLTPALRAEAALVPFGPTAFASHTSAARIHHLPVPTLADEHVTVTDRAERRTRSGVRCHLGTDENVVSVGGVRASDPARTFLELGEQIGLVDLVVVGDHLVATGACTCADLRSRAEGARGRGARGARDAAALVRARVDSPMETRLRMLLVLAGLPEPEVNPTIRDEGGQPLRRYDLYYRRARTAVEYDGRHHAAREEQWQSDVHRRESIDNSGHRLIVVLASDIYRRPNTLLDRVHRVLRDRGEPGVPTRLTQDWRPHFPVR